MGGGASTHSTGIETVCDHTPIFRCFDGVDGGEEKAVEYKERIAGLFSRKSVPHNDSIFNHGVGRQDLVIVEKGELRMVATAAKNTRATACLIKSVQVGEMVGMMELVRHVEEEADPRTGEYPMDVRATKKASLVVLSRQTFEQSIVAMRADEACRLFYENLERLTRASIMRWLEGVVILKDVGEEALGALADVAHFRAMGPGERVIAQHTKQDKLYVVLAGALTVTCEAAASSASAAGHETYQVGSLKPGDFFGESCLLMDEDYGLAPISATADVTTASECLFLYFDAATMRGRLEALPEARNSIADFVRRRLAAQLVAMDLPLFAILRPAALALFTADLVVENHEPGDVVFSKNDPGSDFYVLVEGAVRLTDPDHEPPLDVVLERKGDYFGEVALIRDEPRSATVEVTAPTSLARIAGFNFREICLESPEVAAEFEMKALGKKASAGAFLSHPHTSPLLRKMLDAELASENYKCWDEINAFHDAVDAGAEGPAEIRARAERIYARFVTTDTEELINCSARVCKALAAFFGGDADAPPPRALFDGVLKSITANLRGNLARFLQSPEFKAVAAEWGSGYATKQRFEFHPDDARATDAPPS